MLEARFYTRLEGNKVRCGLCNHHCTIKEDKRGLCGVRENREGTLYSLVYGRAVSAHIDPIEKKPLFHFLPGTLSYSIATVGCNFRCLHCQNWEISQAPKGPDGNIAGRDLPPHRIVEEALEHGCKSISYTYTEPTIFYEYAYDTAVLAHEKDLKNVFVTNGYITEEALRNIQPYLDAANIDLKGFTEKFYKEVCGARLKPVLDNIRLYKELGIWIEITTLLIPGYNDSDKHLEGIAGFIADVSVDIPWHVTAFYPAYKLLDTPPTSVESLKKARKIGLEAGLKHVYQGNIPLEGSEDTICPKCGETIIERSGFTVLENRLREGKCPACKTRVDGIWNNH